jgi:hypothetical protein
MLRKAGTDTSGEQRVARLKAANLFTVRNAPLNYQGARSINSKKADESLLDK